MYLSGETFLRKGFPRAPFQRLLTLKFLPDIPYSKRKLVIFRLFSKYGMSGRNLILKVLGKEFEDYSPLSGEMAA